MGRLRAAGIDDLRDVEAFRPVGRRLAARLDQSEDVDHALGGGRLFFRGQPQELARLRRAHGGGARDLRHSAVRGQHARAGMLEDEGDVVRLQHEVDGDHHGAEPHEGVAQHDEAMGVARKHGDPVAPADAAAREPRREPLGRCVELAVGPARRPAGKTEPVRNPPGAAAQSVGKRLSSRDRVHKSSPKRARLPRVG